MGARQGRPHAPGRLCAARSAQEDARDCVCRHQVPHARYIDAGTGRSFPVGPRGSDTSLPFAGVDVVFNHENVWVARASKVENNTEGLPDEAGTPQHDVQVAAVPVEEARGGSSCDDKPPPPAVLDFANPQHWEPLVAMEATSAPSPRPPRTLRALQSMVLSFKVEQYYIAISTRAPCRRTGLACRSRPRPVHWRRLQRTMMGPLTRLQHDMQPPLPMCQVWRPRPRSRARRPPAGPPRCACAKSSSTCGAQGDTGQRATHAACTKYMQCMATAADGTASSTSAPATQYAAA